MVEGGGGLAIGNNIAVTPGAVISVSVPDQMLPSTTGTMPANAYFNSTSVLVAYGGNFNAGGSAGGSAMTAGYSGGTGGSQYSSWGSYRPAGGGGCAGFTGNGGSGGDGDNNNGVAGSGDAAGGGGGSQLDVANCRSGGGGGGSSSKGHSVGSNPGFGGSFGSNVNGSPGGNGQVSTSSAPYANTTQSSWGYFCGGGAGGVIGSSCGNNFGRAGKGAVRIMWPGDARSYPSTRVADE